MRQFILRTFRRALESLEQRITPASFVVFNTNDSGAGSLRQAIISANATPEADDISFSPFSFKTSETITLTSGELGIENALTISGPIFPAAVTIHGNNAGRIFNTSAASSGIFINIENLTMTAGRTMTSAASQRGGAIRVEDEIVTLIGCTVSNCSAQSAGGAIAVDGPGGSLALMGCVITNNSVSGFTGPLIGVGGAVVVAADATLTIQRTTLSGNSSANGGGAVYVTGTSNVTIVQSTISGNFTNGHGAGLYFQGIVGKGKFSVINSTFSDNRANGSGGAIGLNFQGTAVLRNSTFTKNLASGANGGGIARLNGDGTLLLDSTIIAENVNAATPDLAFDALTSLTGNNNLIGVADLGNLVLSGTSNRTGTLAHPLDPLLGNLSPNGGPTLTHLPLFGSPAINAGNNVATLTEDQRGTGFARSFGGGIDIGAVESPHFVVANTADLGSGSLREVLTAANNFAGGNTITFDAAVFATAPSITLSSGELSITDETTVVGPDSVLTIEGNSAGRIININLPISNPAVTLSKLKLTKGQTTAPNGGGAILINQGIVQFTDCDFSSNVGVRGGALAAFGTGAQVNLVRCVVSGNTATGLLGSGNMGYGGGLYLNKATAVVDQTTISNNQSAFDGGGIYSAAANLTISNSTIADNQAATVKASDSGGGIRGFGHATGQSIAIVNSTISGNSAGAGGGIALLTFAGSLTLRNCTVTDNGSLTSSLGGGLSMEFSPGNLTLESTIIAGNKNTMSTIGTDLSFASAINVGGNNNLIGVANVPNLVLTGTGNQTGTNSLPLDAQLGTLTDNGGLTLTHALLAGSPAIDQGNNVEGLTSDQRGIGFPRTDGLATDIGAFERLSPIVTNTNDAGVGSLRQAILNAETLGGAQTITFSSGFSNSAKTITLTSGEIAINNSLVIAGPGADFLTVSGNNVSRVFNSAKAVGSQTIGISGLTIAKGKSDNGGGMRFTDDSVTLTSCRITDSVSSVTGAGILVVNGSLTLVDCVISNNTTTGLVAGGGIDAVNGANVVLIGCSVSGNSAAANGGGLAMRLTPGSLLVERSTFTGNSAGVFGGGIAFFGAVPAGGMTIRNSTFSGNTASDSGGAIWLSAFDGQLIVQNSTLVQNSATFGSGGGIARSSGTGSINLESSIVAKNSNGNAPDIFTLGNVFAGHCAIFSSQGISTFVNNGGNLAFGNDPKLGPLADNGGPTLTHALLPDSPCISAGSNPGGLLTDQRGPGFPRTTGPAPDIGAMDIEHPIAIGSFANISTTTAKYQFEVSYLGQTSIDASSLGNNDVRVTGPNGFNAAAVFVDSTPATNAPSVTARYEVLGPGGSFDGPDFGAYAIVIQTQAIVNIDGYSVPAGTIGVFQVEIPQLNIVTNLNDAGPGSLRQAILDTNATPGVADTIMFDAALTGIITLDAGSGELKIRDHLTIQGPGASVITISGDDAIRVFDIRSALDLNVHISGLTITQGRDTGLFQGRGAAILTLDEAVTLDGVVLVGNHAKVGSGGALAADGQASITIRNSTIAGNTALYGGGIRLANGAALFMENCTVSGNSALHSQGGGGIHFKGPIGLGGFTIRNSTISGNVAANAVNGQGGGIALENLDTSNAPILIQNCTITNNTSAATSSLLGLGGGGISIAQANVGAIVNIESSVISGNTSANGFDDLSIFSNVILVVSGSAIGDSDGFQLSATSSNNLPFGADLKLGPLADNGGPTLTHALDSDSPLFNAGSNSTGLTTDQRGNGFPRRSFRATDIGAFESQAFNGVFWDGGGGTEFWSNPLNWSTDKLPQPGDNVIIAIGSKVTFNATAGTAMVNRLTCTVPFHLTGGTLQIDGESNFASVFQHFGGTLTGVGVVSLAGGATFSGGTQAGIGTTILPAGQTWTLSTASASLTFSNRNLDIFGTAVWIGDFADIAPNGGSLTVKSGGVFDVQVLGNRVWNGTMPITIEAGGLFKKTIGTGIAAIAGQFNNAGTVQVQTGKLRVSGGKQSGPFNLNTGTLELSFGSGGNGTMLFQAGSSIEGTGVVSVTGSAFGNHTFQAGSVFAGTTPLKVSGGQIDFGPLDVTLVHPLDQTGGGVFGTGVLTLAAGGTMSAGAHASSGVTVIPAGQLLTMSGTHNMFDRNIHVFGQLNWTGAGQILSDTGALIVKSGGIFDVQGDNSWVVGSQGAVPKPITIEAGGLFRKSAGTGTATITGQFHNAGVVDVLSGKLELRTGTQTGTFQLTGGLVLESGGLVFAADSRVEGTGSIEVIRGTHVFQAGSVLTGTNPLTVTGFGTLGLGPLDVTLVYPLVQSGGGIFGTGTLTLGAGGTMTGGGHGSPGITAIPAGQTLIMSGTHNMFDRNIHVFGHLNWTGASVITSDTGSLIVKSGGIFDVQGDNSWVAGSQSAIPKPITIDAGGLFRKSAGTGTTVIAGQLNNAGVVEVLSGKLQLHSGTQTGPFHLTGGLVLVSPGLVFAAGSQVDGTGSIEVILGTHVFQAGSVLTGTNPLTVTGFGTLGLGPLDVTLLHPLLQSGGGIFGSGTFTLGAGGTMTGGGHGSPGITVVPAGQLLTMSGTHNMFDRNIQVFGQLNWTGTGPILSDTGSLIIKSGGIFDIQGDNSWVAGSQSAIPKPITIDAGGLFRKSAGMGTTDINGKITNAGTIEVQTGTLRLAGGLVNFSNTTLSGGNYVIVGTLQFSNANVVTNQASMTLDGPTAKVQNTFGVNALALFAANGADGNLVIRNGHALTVSSTFTNSGSLTVDVGSTFATATGDYVQTAGTTSVAGTLDPFGSFLLQGGTLQSTGSILAEIINSGGTISPGNSPGQLTINGNYAQSNNGLLQIELNGLLAGIEYDQLAVSGTVNVGGNLQVSIGYEAKVGDSYVILANDDTDLIMNEFAGLPDGGKLTVGKFELAIDYQGGDGNDVALAVTNVNSVPPPTAMIQINDGSIQRSMVTSFTFTFSEPVTFPFGIANAFQLVRTGPGTPFGSVGLAFNQVGPIVTVTFDDPIFAPGTAKSLIDGVYSLTLLSSKIQGVGGFLDGNGDGTGGDNLMVTTHRLFGDADGNGSITASDFNAFRLAYGSSGASIFDFNGDDQISAADFNEFRLRYGVTLLP